MSSQLQRGSVIWAPIAGRRGGVVKVRPAVVLDTQAQIDAGVALMVAVVSTSFSFPLQSGWFLMPTDEMTGLIEACVVKATWLEHVPQREVIRISGRAPRRVFMLVLNWLDEQSRKHLRGGN